MLQQCQFTEQNVPFRLGSPVLKSQEARSWNLQSPQISVAYHFHHALPYWKISTAFPTPKMPSHSLLPVFHFSPKKIICDMQTILTIPRSFLRIEKNKIFAQEEYYFFHLWDILQLLTFSCKQLDPKPALEFNKLSTAGLLEGVFVFLPPLSIFQSKVLLIILISLLQKRKGCTQINNCSE